jgi:hypothetical protein
MPASGFSVDKDQRSAALQQYSHLNEMEECTLGSTTPLDIIENHTFDEIKIGDRAAPHAST